MSKVTAKFIPWRFYLIQFFIFSIVLGLICRITDLTILDKDFLREQGDQRVMRLVSTPAFRGMIIDRNGFPLAVSTPVYSVWFNPQDLNISDESVLALAKILNIKPKKLSSVLNTSSKKEFVYLKRGLPPEVAKQIKDLLIPGMYLQQEYKRYYPEGEAAAHLVGFTSIDDKGQEGLELGYNEWLQGEAGKKRVIKDRTGQTIAVVEKLTEEKPGKDLILSIDRRIQFLAYQELMKGVEDNQADSGSAIVLDVKTGEILAMTNMPSYNPNNRTHLSVSATRNRAITDVFEPGSTIKAFTVASALESGKFTTDSLINTSPGWMRVDHNIVKEDYGKNYGVVSLTQILQHSSNVGVTKLVLGMPVNQLWSLLHRMGFGEITGIGFPGEQSGILVKHSPWGAFTLATLSFGYGMSATTLQLTAAYGVLANEGIKLPLSLLKVENQPVGERVLDKKIAKQMLNLLESVMLKGGTGHTIRVPGYRVAGKTGTSRIVGKSGYIKSKHNSSFVGIAPMENPRLVVAVLLNNPQGKKYYGGQVSGPIFANIMEGSLRILNIPPDAVENKPAIQ